MSWKSSINSVSENAEEAKSIMAAERNSLEDKYVMKKWRNETRKMTDSFFDFATELPSLGSGKSREYENELLEAPEEDEIDQLNEETFGEATEEDWEEHHEKLAEEIKSYVGNGDTQDKTHDSLEQSLNRLVIDDDDEPDYHGQPIPRTKKPGNIESLFGPSSPPSFLNTEELVGGPNIWGSPVCDSYLPKQDDGLKTLLKALQKPKTETQEQSIQDPSIISAVQSISTLLPNAVTLREIEQNIVKDKTLQGIRLPASSNQPCIKTLSEVEQELTSYDIQHKKVPSPPLHGFPFPIGTPPRNQTFITPPLPVAKAGTGTSPLGIPVVGRGTGMSVPPPMPTPGHLSTSPPQSHAVGSPSLNRVTLLQRSMPAQIPLQHPAVSQPAVMALQQRSSPVMVHQDRPQDLHSLSPATLLALLSGRSPSPTILSGLAPATGSSPPLILPNASDLLCQVCASPIPILPKAPSPGQLDTPKPLPLFSIAPKIPPQSLTELVKHQATLSGSAPLMRLRPASPMDTVSQNLVRILTSPTPSALLSNGLATSNDIADSPNAPLVNLASQLSSDHGMSPSRLTSGPPPQQRVPHLPAQNDQRNQLNSHQIQRQGPVPSQSVKQPIFPGRGDYHHSRGEFHGNRGEFHGNRGEFHGNRGEFHVNRGEFHVNRGDFHNNRGDFHNNRGDFHNNRGDYHGRGDYHSRAEFHNSRGDFHGNRGDYHNNRGDFHNSRDFHNNRGDFHNGRGGMHGGRGDYFGPHSDFHNIRGYHGGPGYGGRDGYGQGPDGNPRFRGRGYYGGMDNYRTRPRYNSYNEDNSEEENTADKDEYAGLMTKKEKDWVIKIQLMQLQTDNPYLDDYYYTSWAMKRMAKERQTAKEEKTNADGTKAEPKLVIPHLARLDTKSYRPAQFENSLGRVTASSVHNPRQIIDIKRTPSTEQEDAKAREVRHFKEILLDIEKGYDLLLDVDDLEKKALGLPEENRQPLFDQQRQNIQTLFNLVQMRLRDSGNVVQLITVKKGIKLVCRLMSLLPQEENCIIVRGLLQELSAISKKDWQNEVLPLVYWSIVPVISNASLERLVEFSTDLTGHGNTPENNTNSILTALQNKFGSSLIWAMISRGETIYCTQSPVDMDVSHQNKWSEFVSLVAKAVSSLNKDDLAVPHENFPKVIAHVQRFLDKRTFLTVEDKLQLLVTPAVS